MSTNVLAAGKIKFAPELPKRTLDAASKLSLGSYDHIALAAAGQSARPRARRHRHRAEQFNRRRRCCYANIGGSSLCSIDVGGTFGRDLSAQGEAAMVAFAIEWLTKLFGSDVAAAVKQSSVTRWNAAPFALGAMSAASPARKRRARC